MTVAISSLCIVSSVGFAVAALRRRGLSPRLELCSGVCLVAGLGLLGAALHLWR